MYTGRRRIVCITDPGPDPDDVKAILCLAMAHKRRQISLAALIANGGGQPARRAQLARLILDRLGEPTVPVGIGSAGVTVAEQPHECSMRGFEQVDKSRLLDGKALLARTFASEPPGSISMLLISGLRDFADFLTEPASRELVLRKVSHVAIQGGLVADPSAQYGFKPDTSQNNSFDTDAADIVYRFCFQHGIRMSVVSRNAVPLLPMQLARSFALRTESEVLRYLANAQFLGLAGLWKKLLAGALPARCDKAWYFATFCGIDAAEFARRGLAELDETADILSYLNGFIKPYDVVAAMTVLPITANWFSSAAEVTVNGTAHLLLLDAEHAMSVTSVHNLLRETYHSVALLDVDVVEQRGGSWGRVSRLLLGGRQARAALLQAPRERSTSESLRPEIDQSARGRNAVTERGAGTSALQPAASEPERSSPAPGAQRFSTAGSVVTVLPQLAAPSAAAAARLSAAKRASAHGAGLGQLGRRSSAFSVRPLSFRAGPYAVSSDSSLAADLRASGAALVNMMHADRLRSSDGVASHALTGTLLAASVAQAHARQTVVMRRILAVALPMCVGTLVLFLSTIAPTDAGRQVEGGEPETHVAFNRARVFLLTLGFGGTSDLILLCLHPSAEQQRLILAVGLFGAAAIGAAMMPFVTTLLSLLPGLAADWAVGGSRDANRLVTSLAALVQVFVNVGVLARGLPLLWLRRASAQRALDVLWSSLVLLFSGITLVHVIALVAHLIFSPARADPDATFFVMTPILFNALFAAFAASPRLQRRVQALVAQPGSGTAGVVASLAPLLGYASAEGTRDVAELYDEALASMRGLLLSDEGLDALSAAWQAAEGRRGTAADDAAAAGAVNTFKPPWFRLSGARAASAPAARSSTDCCRSSARPSASDEEWSHGDVAWHKRRPLPRVPAEEDEIFLAALARAHTVSAESFDCYVVHCGVDAAAAKIGALRSFAVEFERSEGRRPLAFVDTLCGVHLGPRVPLVPPIHVIFSRTASMRSRGAQVEPHDDASGSAEPLSQRDCPSTAAPPAAKAPDVASAGIASGRAAVRSLEHLPVRLARSSQLLVLASAPLFERLWPAVEIFGWWLTGGGQESIRVLPVVRNEREASALLAAVDAFHVVYCDVERPGDRRRITLAVETATMSAVNHAVRALYAAVQSELERTEQPEEES